MVDGGYDEGYTRCNCFWGKAPAQMVVDALKFLRPGARRVLDLGCGEGKNAAFLSNAGLLVTAVDKSEAAIANAITAFADSSVHWLVADLLAIHGPVSEFDLVVATGSLHCLSTEEQVMEAIRRMKAMTRVGGVNVVYSFNSGPHDMDGHAPSFKPLLLAHCQYIRAYEDWEMLAESDSIQRDRHPHNEVEHSHSITRLMARRGN